MLHFIRFTLKHFILSIFTLIHLAALPIMHDIITTTGTNALLLVTPSVPAKIAAKHTQKQESMTI